MNDEAADPASAFDGQYQLGAEIGAGALGIVYRGVDERLDKNVAIKVWHARFDEITPLREQYDTEARALTALEHPNLVAITDYGIAGEAPYLIMELLDGQTLDARLRASTLPSSLTHTFMESVLRGLGYMHMRGVVHRNLKPDNVFLHRAEDGTETIKLLDMGLESVPANSNMAGAKTMALSQQSPYDSPEQEEGSEPDGRSDVYAAGVLLLHMISGREPDRAELRAAADSAHGLARLAPNATPEVRAFIARAVATERSARFGNADQMLRALLELPTPWSTDPEPQAPAPTLEPIAPEIVSLPPSAAPVHAEFEGSPISELHEQVAQPPAATDDEDFELGPIGLMARLRARKRLFMIAGGVLVLAGAGAAGAMVLGLMPWKFAADGGGEELAAKAAEKAPDAKAKKPDKQKKASEHEGEDEEEESEGEGEQAKAEEGAQPEPLKLSARLGDGEEEKKPASDPEAEALANAAAPGAAPASPGSAAARGAQAADSSAKPGVQVTGEQGSQAAARGESSAKPGSQAAAEQGSQAARGESSAKPGSQAAANERGAASRGESAKPGSQAAAEQGSQAAARGESSAKPGSQAAAEQGSQAAARGESSAKPGSQVAANERGAASPGAPVEPGAQAASAQADETEPGAADEHGEATGSAAPGTAAAESGTAVQGAAAKAAEAEKPKPPTPEEIGSERHIEPDRNEIRQMLALAVAPKPRRAAKNPWDISMPDSLQALRDSIAEGGRGTAGNIKTLRRYNSANPDDVYGHLLLAGFYANRGFSLDALDQYDMAYRIDPSSRGAPEMLKHALDMVSRGIAERDATRFIDRVYGREAQSGITQLLRSSNTSAAAAARLKKLQSRLGAKRR